MKMNFSNTNPNNLSLAEIREEAYKQGRAEGYSQAERDYFKKPKQTEKTATPLAISRAEKMR